MTFPVTSAQPVKIAGIGSGQILITNNGSDVAYVGDSPAVNQNSYAQIIGPGSSISWPGTREVWAVCASGDNTTLSVMYDAEGINGGSVYIAGDVEISAIASPVSVQGGGELLFDFHDTLPLGISVFQIPLGVNGENYSSFRIEMDRSPALLESFITWSFAGYTGSFRFEPSGTAYTPNRNNVALPNVQQLPLTLTVDRTDSSPTNPPFVIRIYGTRVLLARPETDLSEWFRLPFQAVSVNTGDTYHHLPSSFTPYQILLRANTGGGLSTVEVQATEDGNPWVRRYLGYTMTPDFRTAGAMTVGSLGLIPAGGSGWAERLLLKVGSGSGTVNVSILP